MPSSGLLYFVPGIAYQVVDEYRLNPSEHCHTYDLQPPYSNLSFIVHEITSSLDHGNPELIVEFEYDALPDRLHTCNSYFDENIGRYIGLDCENTVDNFAGLFRIVPLHNLTWTSRAPNMDWFISDDTSPLPKKKKTYNPYLTLVKPKRVAGRFDFLNT